MDWIPLLLLPYLKKLKIIAFGAVNDFYEITLNTILTKNVGSKKRKYEAFSEANFTINTFFGNGANSKKKCCSEIDRVKLQRMKFCRIRAKKLTQ